MKRLASAVAVALACLGPAAPADAAVLEITTSIAATDGGDEANFERAVEAAVRTAVEEVRLGSASSFTPTLIVVTRAVTIGERIYVRILLSDEAPDPSILSASPTDI
jgi:hypothetical protein